MRNITILLSFLGILLIAAGCQADKGAGVSPGDAFVGGTSAIKMSFVENSPPSEVTDKTEANEAFEFDATVTIENVGEHDIPQEALVVTMSGFFPGDFGITDTQELKAANAGTVNGVSKDPDGNRIQGAVDQFTFPKSVIEKFAYQKELTGSQAFPFRAEACYPYNTKVLSQVCLMEDLTKKERPVCNPTGSRTVSNSGAPVQVTSITQSVGGRNKLLLNFDVQKVGSSDIFKNEPTETCNDDFKNKNRIEVEVNTGIPGLNCIGLVGGGALDYEASDSTTAKGFTGELLLSGGSGSFTCIQTLSNIDRDSIKTFDVTLAYYARDSVTTNVLVKHLI